MRDLVYFNCILERDVWVQLQSGRGDLGHLVIVTGDIVAGFVLCPNLNGWGPPDLQP